MSSSLSIGVSGMMAQSRKMDVISNNIANSSTLAFKSQWVQFSEQFVAQGYQTNNGNIIQGGSGVELSSVNTDWSTGDVQITNDPTDLMIAGDGFLPVAFNGEVYYTRAGDFSLVANPSGDGSFVMMRPDGSMLIGFDALGSAPDPANVVSFISSDLTNLIAPSSFTVGSDGVISAKPDSASSNPYIVVNHGQLGVQRFNNMDSLMKASGGLYQPTAATSFASNFPVEPGTEASGTISQGALEGSNTDLIVEFADMITCQRFFQASSKVITTADEMLQTVMGLKR